MNLIATDNTHTYHNSTFLAWALWLLLAVFSCLTELVLPEPAFAFDHLHKLFSSELHKYVRENGVLYAKWKDNQTGLDQYLDTLSAVSEAEYKDFDVQQKEALWLNAYNAMAIKLILNHYPINGINQEFPANSIRQIPNTWDAISRKIAGREVTLYTIAHDILRRDPDCRTHFAVAPATRGGGALQNEAFEARIVERELNEITREFLARPENLSCDIAEGTITVSQIFKWFPLDFLFCTGAGRIPMPPPKDDDVVRDYIMQFLPRETKARLKGKELKVNYAPYDWSLNDASTSEANRREKQ